MIDNLIFFYTETLAPRPTPNLEDHPLSAVRNCLFNISAATLHMGGHSSIHYLRMHHAVVTVTHISWRECNSHLKTRPFAVCTRQHYNELHDPTQKQTVYLQVLIVEN